MAPLPIEGVPVHCTCRWEWLVGAQELTRALNQGCVEHGEPTWMVVAWLLTPAFRDHAVNIATGAQPMRDLVEFCDAAVRIAQYASVAGRVWRALGREWDAVNWSEVVQELREAG